jgi:hypothetical protein
MRRPVVSPPGRAQGVAAERATRSLRPDVRNPVLQLPAVARLDALDERSRAALRCVPMDLRTDAQAKAAKCWRAHKAMMAAYWQIVAVYAGHIARALRPRQACLPLTLREHQ